MNGFAITREIVVRQPINPGYVPLNQAVLCCSCEAIYHELQPTCPSCANENRVRLGAVQDKP